MRLGFVLFAAVASLLASSNALSISKKSESSTVAKSPPGVTRFVDGTIPSTRSLRGQDPASEDSDDEERGAAELERVVSSLPKKAQSSVSSLNIYDEIKALEAYYKQLQASYMPVFKDLALVKGTTPEQVGNKLGMWKNNSRPCRWIS
ncbi:hypothetical protein PHYSODRAFT_286175 [Phytophthora sojae]|uniref:RxLR effector protein n=2 Tax=Phytophthora sojae TaxID=67593 RepID=G4ZLJ9_PHYSP|nr:hypothetical protein PHYSODRAFT_286175 [Phytophthora sojae]AEK81195.1 Avh336 [Phytophthora sojae]AEK81196.1 Avh336 [Phytophthora sojae]EGZ14574.1 hypothetical protein PHYSODRAFT_286175 [Phytophthora sojae]|eukprot:XP_009528323.1 hypothetical protein PHYSODRAFT_286175 [Phytophthora sojae]